MRFSVRVQYGLQALLELALNFGGGPVQIKAIARDQKIPIRFLEQLLLILKRNGLVASSRGKKGGYTLARSPGKISLAEVVEIFEGPIELAGDKLKRAPALFDLFANLQKEFRGKLSAVTLDDLALRKRQKDREYVYSI